MASLNVVSENTGDLSSDLAFQERSLQEVSRTFALTIPQLPEELRTVVGNAYLLCRIADTIEDSDTLTLDEKKRFAEMFVAVVQCERDAEAFAEALAPVLAGSTLEAERDLIANTPSVIRLTHSFSAPQQAAIQRCVRIMSEGMEAFQKSNVGHGLPDVRHMDAYCYHVAGVVGEMLTDLFCAYSPAVARHRKALSALAVSFGQGLQMTNILKDVWEDKTRQMCWLPRALFEAYGFNLDQLSPENSAHGAYQAGLAQLIGVTNEHLRNALRYTLLIPKSEKGIRRFCLWAIGMAVLTLRKINRNRQFTAGAEVKITRRSVGATIWLTRLLGWSDTLLRMAFRLMAAGLPRKKGAAGAC